jgi:signal transduction histidine kinase
VSTKTLFFKISTLFVSLTALITTTALVFAPTPLPILMIVLISVVIFLLLLKRVLYPLTCLINICHKRSEGSLDDFACPGTQEVIELSEAVNQLTQSHQNMCDQKQDIFKEAAHELKSPIAILKARLSLFDQKDNSDKSEFVKHAKLDIDHITVKLKELLFLKEVEWDMQQAKEHFHIQDQCDMMRDVFAPILEKKDLQIKNESTEDFALYVHKTALAKVMQAVFENIFYHTKNGTTISTTVNAKNRSLEIKNVIGTKSDETLFSSSIGMKIIERISDKMNYSYATKEEDGNYITTVTFLEHN